MYFLNIISKKITLSTQQGALIKWYQYCLNVNVLNSCLLKCIESFHHSAESSFPVLSIRHYWNYSNKIDKYRKRPRQSNLLSFLKDRKSKDSFPVIQAKCRSCANPWKQFSLKEVEGVWQLYSQTHQNVSILQTT